jgi:hypothetical protein
MATQKNRGATKADAKTDKPASKAVTTAKTQDKKDQLPATIDMSAHSGAGLENTDRDSFAIPFLAIMQKGSPQVDKDSDSYIKGVEVGDLLLTTSGEVFKDEDGVNLIFCGYRRVFLRWAPLDEGGGFKGELAVEDVARQRAEGKIVEEEGKLFADNGDIIKDTRVHYILVMREDAPPVPAVLSMSSTQIKKSKMLLTQIQSYVATDSKGKGFTPPSFGHIFHAETVAESNDKGAWRGWKFSRAGFVEDPQVFNAAREFNETVRGEGVRVNYEASGLNDAAAPLDDDDAI